MKLIYVEWLDANYEEGPLCEEHFERGVILKLAGFLVKEDAEIITVAAEADGDNWRYVIHIPISLIRKRKTFKLP